MSGIDDPLRRSGWLPGADSLDFLRKIRYRALLRRGYSLLKARGIFIVLVACVVGAISGAFVSLMSFTVQQMHWFLFGLPKGARLSSMFALFDPQYALVPAAGGVVMGLSVAYLRYRNYRGLVDPIEANALHGGRMSMVDTLIVVFQTMVSSGCGASVGLESGYTQMGSGIASRLARTIRHGSWALACQYAIDITLVSLFCVAPCSLLDGTWSSVKG